MSNSSVAHAGSVSSSSLLSRTGTAPITWGICEVPGWGAQLPVERVLAEMRVAGFTATELGSAGYLPTDPTELKNLLDVYGLRLTGGFVALALHDRSRREETLASARQAASLLAQGGATAFVTCAVADPNNWERPTLSDDEWNCLVEALDEVGKICADNGLQQVLHPHVDSLIETADEMKRVLEASEVKWVLETGHMTIGGLDPLWFAQTYPERVGLVHLKDVTASLIQGLNSDEMTLMQAVQAGIFPALGDGDVDLASVIVSLEESGYRGEYVVEQDVALEGGMPAAGEGPLRDVQKSVTFLRTVERQLGDR